MHGVESLGGRPKTPLKNVLEGIFDKTASSAMHQKYKEIAGLRKHTKSSFRKKHSLMHTKASILTETFLADKREKMELTPKSGFRLKRFMNVPSRIPEDVMPRRAHSNIAHRYGELPSINDKKKEDT